MTCIANTVGPALALVLAGAAQGSLSQASVTAPGGLAQAASYFSTSGGGVVAGADAVSASAANSQEFLFSNNSSATASAAATSGNISNGADGTFGLGYATMQAHNSAPNNASFPISITNGGWKETFTVNSPSHVGQAGYMVFQIRCRGSIDVAGFAGSASLYTSGYKNNTELGTNTYFNRGPSDAITTDRQRTQWGLSSTGQPLTRTFDGLVTMAVPVTFGQSFSLGVYAAARASMRSSSSVGGISTGTLMGGQVTWAGITSIITSAGVPVTDAVVSHASPVDWTLPYSPCGTADFNGDGDVGTDADIEAFFACLGGDCCATCYAGGADFNGDGDVGTDADIEAFFRVLSGGAC